jgi:hypothetical protein
MGVIKDRHGTYYAQQKVPEWLQQAVALVLGNGKARQAYLKKSLGTRDLKTANRVAKTVQVGFDEVLQKAEASLRDAGKPPARRTSLSDAEIAKMAEHVFAKGLAFDERMRFGGKPEWQQMHEEARRQAEAEGRQSGPAAYDLHELKSYGNPNGWLEQERANVADDLSSMRDALALGDISAVEDEVEIALADVDISLDTASAAYRKVGTAVLQRYVEMLEAIEARNAGKVVTTPKAVVSCSAPIGGTLREALEGWKKERVWPENGVQEYTRAVEMFIQLHGNLPRSYPN